MSKSFIYSQLVCYLFGLFDSALANLILHFQAHPPILRQYLPLSDSQDTSQPEVSSARKTPNLLIQKTLRNARSSTYESLCSHLRCCQDYRIQ